MEQNSLEEPELEEQFILRLPEPEANKLRKLLSTKPEKLKKHLKIDLDVSKGTGTVALGKTKLYAYLKKFPTVMESYKANLAGDKSNMFKTADVVHMLECHKNPVANVKQDLPHGYSAPLKNVQRKRFRKTLVNLEMAEATEMITKELYYLLSTDLQAASTRFELIESERCSASASGEFEKMLFGQVSSSESGGSEAEIVVD